MFSCVSNYFIAAAPRQYAPGSGPPSSAVPTSGPPGGVPPSRPPGPGNLVKAVSLLLLHEVSCYAKVPLLMTSVACICAFEFEWYI